MTTPIDKLTISIIPLLNTLEKNIKEKIEHDVHELNVKMDILRTELQVVAKNASGAKKPVKKDAPADPANPDAPKPAEATPAVKFDSNKMVWFKRNFKDNEAFRNRYLDELAKVEPKIRELMENDPTTVAKKNEEEKRKSKSQFIWLYIKTNNAALSTQIATEFNDAKNAHAMQNKPVQQGTEAHTPEKEEADAL
jgi:hypothetical protein